MSKSEPMSFTVERITPNRATSMLAKHNGHQRPLRPLTISRYAHDMEDGYWRETAEPIILDKDENVLDGQHRLYAVATSGKPQNFVVCRNADPETFLVIDNGAPRKVSDTTDYTQHEVSVGRAMLRGGSGWVLAPSNARLHAFIEAHKEAIRWAQSVMTVGGLKPVAPVRGAMARSYGNVDLKVLDRFKYILAKGVDEDGWVTSEDGAVIALRNELLGVVRHRAGQYSPRTETLSAAHVYRLTELAIIRFEERREIKSLRLPQGFAEAWPLPEDSDPSLHKKSRAG